MSAATFVDALVVFGFFEVLALGIVLPVGLGLGRWLRRRPPESSTRRRWLKRIAIANGAAAVLVGGGLAIFELGFSEELLRWVLDHAEERTGIRVTYESAAVRVLGATAELRGVHVVRRNHPEGDVDLRVDRVAIDVAGLGLWRPTKRIESLTLHGIRGTMTRRATVVPKRRAFRLERFELADARVTLHLERRGRWVTLPLTVDSLHSEDIRSHALVLDLLRHSRGSGRVAGAVFVLDSAEAEEDSRVVRWKIQNAGVALVRDLVAGPLRYLKEGSCHFHADERWPAEGDVHARWQLACEELRLHPGEKAGVLHSLVDSASAWLEKRGGRLALDLKFRTDRDRFDVTSSAGVAHAATRALAQTVGARVVQSVVDWAKRAWRRHKDRTP
jgi:hypothetical protein